MFRNTKTANKKIIATLKIRSKTIQLARQWLNKNDYIEIQGPTLIPASGEWRGYFKTEILNKKAYLTQGLHPYDRVFVENLEKIFTFAPTFREEKTQTPNHLLEYWRIEVVQKTNLQNIIKVQEQLIEYICQNLSKTAKEQLANLNTKATHLRKVKAPFQKITYEKAIKMLQKNGSKIVWGQNLDKTSEKKLSNLFDQPFFITQFPLNSQTYFYESLKEKTELTKSVDLIAPQGYGELSSGSQRITNNKTLTKKMQEIQANPEDQKWYLSFIKNNNTPQSGFAIGFERLIQWICNLREIKDTTAYPRSPDSIYP